MFTIKNLKRTLAVFTAMAVLLLLLPAGSAEPLLAIDSAPAAPQNLSAAPGNGQVQLDWDASAGADSYSVYIFEGESPPLFVEEWELEQSGVDGTTFTVTGLTNGTTYWFAVSAVGAGGESELSAFVSAAPAAPAAPPEPQNLSAVPGDKQVQLDWDPSVGADSYSVYIFEGESPPLFVEEWELEQSGVDGITFTVTELTNGTKYWFAVTAVGAGGESELSASVSATPSSIGAPARPENLTAACGDQQAHLNWSASLQADSYNIYRYEGTSPPLFEFEWDEEETDLGDTNHTVSGLNNGTQYWFSVTAVNDDGESALSTPVTVTPSEPNSDAGLASLTTSTGSLQPSFNPAVTTYMVNVSYNVVSIDITAVLSDPVYAAMSINGEPQASGVPKTIELGDPGSSTAIMIEVIAEDALTTETYTITVERAADLATDADLSALVVNPGVLDPAFTPAGTEYTVEVAHDISSIDVTATFSDLNAIMAIDGQPAASGEKVTVDLNDAGTVTVIEVVVTAEDGETENTYTITVNREAEPDENGIPDPPVLTSPAAGANVPGEEVTFSWGASARADRYFLRVVRLSDSHVLFNQNIGNLTSYTLGGFEDDGEAYLWRVWAGNLEGWSSPVSREFVNGSPAVIPAPPELISPANGANVPGEEVTFLWGPQRETTRYFLRVIRLSDNQVVFNQNIGNKTSYTLDGFEDDGEAYLWRVAAGNDVGWSAYSDRTFVNGAPPIPAPPVLTSPAAGANVPGEEVTFSWEASVGATRYFLRVINVSSGQVVFNQNIGDQTSYILSGFADSGEDYLWRVAAGNDTGWSGYANREFVNGATAIPAPPALTSPDAGAIVPGEEVTLSWEASVGATRYFLRVINVSSGQVVFNQNIGDQTSYILSGFADSGEEYFWRVAAGNDVGWSAYSDRTFVNGAPAIPAPPALTSPAAGANVPGEEITLSWEASVGATRYFLRVINVSSGQVVFNQNIGDQTSYILSGFTDSGEAYLWRVAAGNDTGWSAYSDRTFVNGATAIPAPPALTSPAAGANVPGEEVTLSWEASVGATRYFLRVINVSSGQVVFNQNIGDQTSYILSGFADSGEEYRWRVAAGNDVGWSAYSDRTFVNGSIPE